MNNSLSLKWAYPSQEISEDFLKFSKAINIIHATFIQDILGLQPEILEMSEA